MSTFRMLVRTSWKASVAFLLVLPPAFLLAQETQRPAPRERDTDAERRRPQGPPPRPRELDPRIGPVGPPRARDEGRRRQPPPSRAVVGPRDDAGFPRPPRGPRLPMGPETGGPAHRPPRFEREFAIETVYRYTTPDDRRARELAEKYNRTESEPEKDELREQLTELTERTFEERLRERREELERMRERMEKISQQLDRREELRDQIVQRRVKDLLNEPDPLDWDINLRPGFPSALSQRSFRDGRPLIRTEMIERVRRRPGDAQRLGRDREREERERKLIESADWFEADREAEELDREEIQERTGGAKWRRDEEERDEEEIDEEDRDESDIRQSIRRGLETLLDRVADQLDGDAREAAREQLESVQGQIESLQEQLDR